MATDRCTNSLDTLLSTSTTQDQLAADATGKTLQRFGSSKVQWRVFIESAQIYISQIYRLFHVFRHPSDVNIN